MKSLSKRIAWYPHLKSAYVKADSVCEYLKKIFPKIKIKYTGEESGHGCGMGDEDIDFIYELNFSKNKVSLSIMFDYEDKSLSAHIELLDKDENCINSISVRHPCNLGTLKSTIKALVELWLDGIN